jgi:hypothetical protein
MTEAHTDKLLGGNALLTPPEAAEALRRTVKTLASWRSAGRGPRWVKLEGRCAYRLDDLRQFIAGEDRA